MSRKSVKSQASSSRAFSGGFDAFGASSTTGFGGTTQSQLSHVYEPPNLTNISNPQIVVALKNIQKKDSTTRSKALEDLQEFVKLEAASDAGIEEDFLQSWIKVYPRASIDNARRVRLLAHTVQGQIASACGKRIAKYLVSIAGPWLLGIYDTDKAVSRATQESFRIVFPTEEKYRNVWKTFQSEILVFVRDVIVHESASTLSDERVTSPDDARAKYDRTLAGVLQMAGVMLDEGSQTEMSRIAVEIDDFLRNDDLWKLASASDAFVRRSLYRLSTASVQKRRDSLNPATLSSAMLARALHIDQTGSMTDYVKCLVTISEEFPSVWTTDYKGEGKKSAHNRLCQFLRQGTASAPSEIWVSIQHLLRMVPHNVLLHPKVSKEVHDAADEKTYPDILDALHAGVIAEGSMALGQGWLTYLDLCDRLCGLFQGENLTALLQEYIWPLLAHYVRPSHNRSWSPPEPDAAQICCEACEILLKNDRSFFETKWLDTSASVMEDMKISLPEQSKDYQSSQDAVISETARWYSLYSALLRLDSQLSFRSFLLQGLHSEVSIIVTLLKNRNGKPYGAASALIAAIDASAPILEHNEILRDELQIFANIEIPKLILSPSSRYLAACMDKLLTVCDVREGVKLSIAILDKAPESQIRSDALRYIFASPGLVQTDAELADIAGRHMREALSRSNRSSWDLVDSVLANSAMPDRVTYDLLAHLTEGLSVQDSQVDELEPFEHLEKKYPQRLRHFSSTKPGASLLTKLITLSDSSELELAARAQELGKSMQINSNLKTTSGASSSALALIQSGFSLADSSSLSVESLVRQATLIWDHASAAEKPSVIKDLLPQNGQWTSALRPHLARRPLPSLTACTSLGSALFLTQAPDIDIELAARDADGQSLALRLARYCLLMCDNQEFSGALRLEHKVMLTRHLSLLSELANDDVSAVGSTPLLALTRPSRESVIDDFTSNVSLLLSIWASASVADQLVEKVQTELVQGASGRSASAYYHARAYTGLVRAPAGINTQGARKTEFSLKDALQEPEIFRAIAMFSTEAATSDPLRSCNDLLSRLTGRDLARDEDRSLLMLVSLDVLLQQFPDMLREIPQQRLVFFAKHLADQLPVCPASLQIEILRTSRVVLTPIQDVYGTFWGDFLQFLGQALAFEIDEASIGLMCVALQLCAHLQKLCAGDVNDDLLDAWNDEKDLILDEALNLLLKLRDMSDQSHQPRRMLNETLQRMITRAKTDIDIDPVRIYPGLGSESIALQNTAYCLLQDLIPRKQDDISLEKGVDQSYIAKLPDELLSLIMTTPSVNDIDETDIHRSLPIELRSYLLSWKLTLLHWDKASVAVQADYTKSLQEADCIPGLLGFIIDFSITSRHKPLDATRFSIDTYIVDNDDPPETDLNHLLLHLYYLIFLYLPSPAKTWWRDSTFRQTNIAVQAWTEKYFSPLIANVELSAVKDWAATSTATNQADSSEPNLTVKVSLTAREITASVPIDDRTTAICIRLPTAYPLARAEVISVQRVGFAESKWQSWIRIAQGQLMISDGGSNALIDCLLAWKRNVTAAMKGQTECAICYSVVGTDKTLPKKDCPTCKHRFHASCLYRWFKSSNSSSCPLCRNVFVYS